MTVLIQRLLLQGSESFFELSRLSSTYEEPSEHPSSLTVSEPPTRRFGKILADLLSATVVRAEAPVAGIGGTEQRALNSTAVRHIPEELECKVERAFDAAREEEFEDGMESEFSRTITDLIQSHGDLAMGAVNKLMLAGRASPEAVAEALRWIGQIRDPETHLYRVWVLRQGLKSNLPRIRDGALLGLSFLEDPRAIPDLEQAIGRESCLELRADLDAALALLKRTR